MKLDALNRLFGKKSTKPQDPEQAAAALAELDAELDAVLALLARAEADQDAGLLEAVATNDDATLASLREAVENARRRVELLRMTRTAVERHHKAAQEAQEARRLADRWAAARRAADERRGALVRLEQALNDAGAAIVDANGAFARMLDLLPARLTIYPDGFPSHELAALVTMQLSVKTNGAIRSAMPLSPFELAKLPGMVARHDAGVPLVFAAAPVPAAAKEA